MKKLIYALRFMTILPIPWSEKEDLIQVSRSSGMFPLVGLLIGLLLGGTFSLFRNLLSLEAIAFLQTLIWVFITGGLHLDGLSDTFDGIGSGRERERMLEIMKDSSIGAFGALSLILQILLKFVFIREINTLAPWLILLAPVCGRWGQLIAIYYYPSARKNGMGIFFRDHIRPNEVIFGLVCTILIFLSLLPWHALFILAAHSLTIILVSSGISNKLNGLTGDVYGLVCETGESAALILTVLYLSLITTMRIGLGGFPLFEGLNKLIHLFFQ